MGGSAIVRLPCTVALADERKPLVFFKGAGGSSQGRKWRGEEAGRAAAQLSDISSQTERRHLGYSCKTTRPLFHPICFRLFSFFSISILGNLNPARWCIIPCGIPCEQHRLGDAVHEVKRAHSSTASAPDASGTRSSSALQHSGTRRRSPPPPTRTARLLR